MYAEEPVFFTMLSHAQLNLEVDVQKVGRPLTIDVVHGCASYVRLSLIEILTRRLPNW